MQILASRFLRGSNIHHSGSIVVVTIDLAAMPRVEAALVMPSVVPWRPSAASGLPEALRAYAACWSDAAFAPTVLERALDVALALQRERTVSPPGHAAVLERSGSKITVAVGCEIDTVGLAALQMALLGAPLFAGDATARSAPALRDLAAQLDRYRKVASHWSLDQLTIAMVRKAAQRGIPWLRMGAPHRFIQLGYGSKGRRCHETMTDTTGHLAVRLTANKAATTQLLGRLGYPVPRQRVVHDADTAAQVAGRMGRAVVVKPCHGAKGHAVAVGLVHSTEIREAFAAAAEGGDSVVVEEFVHGDDHRLLVVGGKFVAAALRVPARVTGNGSATIRELIDQMNEDPRRGRHYERLMEVIDPDRETLAVLARQGYSLDTVLPSGCHAALRRTANISRGGSAEDVTGRIHPDNLRMAEEVAAAVGLDVAGIDFLTPDIARSWRDVGGGIVEVNANPGLRPHWIADPDRDVLGPIIDLMLPRRTTGRVPTAMVTGSVGKTTTCRMLAHILRCAGMRTGLATTMGVFLDDVPLRLGDLAGGSAVADLLLHPALDAGVFEMARGGLLKAGTIIDSCDVGAVLNVLDNHLGLDGIQTREDMARVKRLVAANATAMVVLNADDPHCMAMRPQLRARRLCLVACGAEHPELAAHRAAGGCSVRVEGQGAQARIVLAEGSVELGSIELGAIPASLGGRAMGKAANAAFAIGMAHGLGIPFATAGDAMRRFYSSYEMNPGRMNFLPGRPFEVLLDWCDGPQAAAELASVARQTPVSGKRWLLLAAVGNRPDDFLIGMGRALSRGFDRLVCSNYRDLRGRPAADVPGLLRRGMIEGGAADERIRCVEDFPQALREVLEQAQAGDLVVIGAYESELARRIVAGGEGSRPAGPPPVGPSPVE